MDNVKCEAYGCPLIGHKHDTNMSLCLFHFGTHFSDFNKITTRVKAIEFAINHYFKCKRAIPDFVLNPDKYHKHERASLCKRPEETHFQYLDRMWDSITEYIQKGVRSKEVESNEEAFNHINHYAERFNEN